MENIYLDNCATTPVAPEVAHFQMKTAVECFGNPSSIHTAGQKAAAALSAARQTIARSLHALPSEIIFTASGTEANNLALGSAIRADLAQGPVHVITTATEHASTRVWLEREAQQSRNPLSITWLPVDSHGLIKAPDLQNAFQPHTRVVSILHCNNETGALQDLSLIHI